LREGGETETKEEEMEEQQEAGREVVGEGG
jgi:hypothetical protein